MYINTYYCFSEWSVIYVGIFISLLLAGSICGIIFISFRKRKPRVKSNSRSRKSRYTRLEQNDQNFELRSKFAFYVSFIWSHGPARNPKCLIITHRVHLKIANDRNVISPKPKYRVSHIEMRYYRP